jgi:hypothetical protein
MILFDKLNKFRPCISDKNKLIDKQTVKSVPFDELPPYPVRSFTYHNEQFRADELQRVIVYKAPDRPVWGTRF